MKVAAADESLAEEDSSVFVQDDLEALLLVGHASC